MDTVYYISVWTLHKDSKTYTTKNQKQRKKKVYLGIIFRVSSQFKLTLIDLRAGLLSFFKSVSIPVSENFLHVTIGAMIRMRKTTKLIIILQIMAKRIQIFRYICSTPRSLVLWVDRL